MCLTSAWGAVSRFRAGFALLAFCFACAAPGACAGCLALAAAGAACLSAMSCRTGRCETDSRSTACLLRLYSEQRQPRFVESIRSTLCACPQDQA